MVVVAGASAVIFARVTVRVTAKASRLVDASVNAVSCSDCRGRFGDRPRADPRSTFSFRSLYMGASCLGCSGCFAPVGAVLGQRAAAGGSPASAAISIRGPSPACRVAPACLVSQLSMCNASCGPWISLSKGVRSKASVARFAIAGRARPVAAVDPRGRAAVVIWAPVIGRFGWTGWTGVVLAGYYGHAHI